MASYTPNLNLKKPAGSEAVVIGDINGNMDLIDTAVNAANNGLQFQRGDTFSTHGSQFPCRSLADKSGIYFSIKLPKNVASNVNSFTVNVTADSNIWFSGGDIGIVQSGATAGLLTLAGKTNIKFSLPTSQTIQSSGFGICELNVTITFGA